MLSQFKQLLLAKTYDRSHPAFQATIEFVNTFPGTLSENERAEIRALIRSAFQLSEEDLNGALYNAQPNLHNKVLDADEVARRLERELYSILPKRGFLRNYADYTEHSEAPLAYHVFSALCAVGTVFNRRVFLDMGYYKLFPTLGIIILGPSGIKKTSATNIAVELIQQLGVVKVYSEKLTPEALIEAMKGGNATGLIYAPEMTVFLNKQKYNEGLVQLITRFMDCPDKWDAATIGRGTSTLSEIGISSLMCSTLDWFIRSTPEDSFGGGFVARNLLIVQETSPRSEPIPRPGDANLRDRLLCELAYLHTIEGECFLDKRAYDMYVDWYNGKHRQEAAHPEHELLSTYYNRKPDHMKRVAMILHITTCDNLHICGDCFSRALELLDWSEKFLPAMLRQMFKSATGEEQDLVLKTIRNNGIIRHSDLVRKLGYRMDAQGVRRVVSSLKEQLLITEINNNAIGHAYTIREDHVQIEVSV